MTKKTLNVKDIFTLFASGVKRNYKPAIVLWAAALGIVLAYYFLPGTGAFMDRIGHLKEKYGYLFSALSTMFFGGLLPYAIILISGRIEKKDMLPHLLFYLLFWFWKGAEVDLLYRLQGIVFGTEPSFFVVVKKSFADQFIYGPLWAAPTMMLFYLWKDSGFSFKTMKTALGETGFVQRTLSVLIPNMIVWVPSTLIVYSLPQNLQLPLFNIVLTFWALILQFVVKGKSE